MEKAVYDSTEDTNDHKQMVYDLLFKVVEELATRAVEHDLSKLGPVEKPVIDERGLMKNAIAHHHAVNRHHPEHFKKYQCARCLKRFNIEVINCPECGYSLFSVEPEGIKGMNIVDIIEMLCDIKAMSTHDGSDMMKRLELHQKRYRYSDELAWIFKNTVGVLDA